MRNYIVLLSIIIFCTNLNVFSQSYGDSYATTTNNSEVIGRVLFGDLPWSADDILSPSETSTDTYPCTGYSDFTIGNSNLTDGNTTDDVYVKGVQKGFTYELEVEGGFCGGSTNTSDKAIKVYIDYNDDGDFLDATELVWTSPYDNAVSPVFNTSITIPLTATSLDGELRMRIIYNRPVPGFGVYLWENLFTPTSLYTFGETEDYTLILTAYIESISTDSALCYGSSDGEITIVPDPTAPAGVEYSINGLAGPWSGNLNYTGLPSGLYNVWARFQNDPSDPASTTYEQYSVTVNQPADITFNTNVSDYNGSDITCAGTNDGEIYITSPTGGWSGNYNYTISPDGGATLTTQATGTFIALVDGDYDVSVVDDNGCQSTNTITLADPPDLSFGVVVTSNYNGEQVSCFGACDATVSILPLGGTPGYTYFSDGLSNGSDNEITGLCAGNVDFQVVDLNSCAVSVNIPITQPVELEVASANISSDYFGYPISCSGASDGEITIAGVGGVQAYNFSVSGAPPYFSTSSIGGLSAGSYDAVVQDANGCVSDPVVVNVTEPAALAFNPVTVDLPISCNGESNGKIILSALGGTGGYDYSITGGAPYQDGVAFVNLSAGSYQIAVQDDNGCEWSEEYILTEPDQLQFTASITSNYNGEDVSCYQSNDGIITVNPTGGTEPYVYDTNGGIPLTMLPSNGEISGLSAGTYSIIISDLNGCPTTPVDIDLTLNEPDQLVISQLQVLSDVSCFGESDGSLLIFAQGGTGSYTYYAGGTYPTSNTNPFTVSAMSAGTYNISVEDDNGCISPISIIDIQTPDELIVTVIPSNLGCNGDESGSASLNVTGGFPDFDYFWSNGQITDIATNLSAGDYSVTVVDENDCSDTEEFVITQPEAVTEALDVGCFGDATGEILATVNDPNPTAIYSYSWDDNPGFQTTPLATNLAAGTYTVYITDQFGCILTATDSVLQPDSIAVFVEHTSICQYEPFAIAVVHASGGIDPYDYDWSTLENTTSIIIQNDGSYSVTVTDSSGCQATHPFIIDPLIEIGVTFNTVEASCIDNTDASIIPNVTGGYPPFVFEWSNYTTEAINQGIGAGTYSVDIYDSHGCLLTEEVQVAANQTTCLEVYSAFTPNGDENNDYWFIGNIELYPDALVEVFNRWGDRVFAGKRYINAWDGAWTGMFKGNPLPSATYYYVITLNNGEDPYKGTVTIVR